jgi:hypothetical protein
MATFLKLGRESTPQILAVRPVDHENERAPSLSAHARSDHFLRTRGAIRLKSAKIAELKPKKKCCRSKPRCKRCPLVLHKVRKAEHAGLRGKELDKVFKRARKA